MGQQSRHSEGRCKLRALLDGGAAHVPGSFLIVGFRAVAFHHARKLTSAEWCREVTRGKLATAAQSLSPVRRAGPWTVLCDNEAFCTPLRLWLRRASVHGECLRLPQTSTRLRSSGRGYAVEFASRIARTSEGGALQSARCPCFKARVLAILASKEAQHVAARIAAGFRTTCKEVVAKKRGMARG